MTSGFSTVVVCGIREAGRFLSEVDYEIGSRIEWRGGLPTITSERERSKVGTTRN